MMKTSGLKALVIGQGGREHALVRALKLSKSVAEVHALPGSDGIAQDARCHALDWKNFGAVAALARELAIDFVMIGPENPLVDGLSNALREVGVAVVGPSREAALLEGSKIFCKDFLVAAGVPTARSQVVSTVDQALQAAKAYAPPYVLKADGLAAGKGVFICKTLEDLRGAAHSIFVEKSLGEAGARALLEEFSPGYEISYLVLTNGETFEPLPLAQDHKRLLDGDEGPNTGGMGVVAPVAMEASLRERIDREVLQPTMAEFKKRGFVYRGVLFVGIMMTEQGPSVLEFNTRFGDPETQAILPLLEERGDQDWGLVLRDLAHGELRSLTWKKMASCCVVLAAEGYPDSPVKGALISGLGVGSGSGLSVGAGAGAASGPGLSVGAGAAVGSGSGDGAGARAVGGDRYFLHAGTRLSDGKWQTSGGRVLGAMGLGANLREAVDRAYEQARSVCWDGIQLRSDIGAKVL